jgi:hypothetical protein
MLNYLYLNSRRKANMKLAILAMATLAMVGCASNPTTQAPVQSAPVQTATPTAHAVAPRPSTGAPEWFVRLPASTETMVYAAGTAVSSDEQMAYDKARMSAERKLVEQAHAVIITQTKSFRNDTGRDLQERFETVTRKNAQGQIVGVRQVDSQAHYDGRQYKVYVLIQLPIGEANAQQEAQTRAQSQREADLRARRAEQEMDRNQGALQKQREEQDLRMREDLGPQSLAPGESFLPPASQPVPVQRVESIQLLDVDNEEYRQRRDAALQKPGAVIGHITVR